MYNFHSFIAMGSTKNQTGKQVNLINEMKGLIIFSCITSFMMMYYNDKMHYAFTLLSSW
jgi:ABC-type amino acid transport system permease subunit